MCSGVGRRDLAVQGDSVFRQVAAIVTPAGGGLGCSISAMSSTARSGFSQDGLACLGLGARHLGCKIGIYAVQLRARVSWVMCWQLSISCGVQEFTPRGRKISCKGCLQALHVQDRIVAPIYSMSKFEVGRVYWLTGWCTCKPFAAG